MGVTVVKRDGKKKKFSNYKLELSIKRAAKPTSVDNVKAKALASMISSRIERTASKNKDSTIRSTVIQTTLLSELGKTKAGKEIATSFRKQRRQLSQIPVKVATPRAKK